MVDNWIKGMSEWGPAAVGTDVKREAETGVTVKNELVLTATVSWEVQAPCIDDPTESSPTILCSSYCHLP